MANALRGGSAEVVITSPLGSLIAGAYHAERAEQVLSDLYAKAIVLDDGYTRVAIITADILSLTPDVANRIRARVEDLTGIPTSHVMLTTTHTHTGPVTFPLPWYEPDPAYLDTMIRRIADAAAGAAQRLQPVRLRVGRGREDSVSFNRRFWMADGTLRTNPPYQDPDIVRAAGPIDPDVLVLRLDDLRGQPVVILVNFAMHPAMVGGLDFPDGPSISADFPGAMAAMLKDTYGHDVVIPFANGCCGNINHRDRSQPGPQAGQAVANWIGGVLAGEVIKVNARLASVPDGLPLTFGSRTVDVRLRLPSEEEVAWARDFMRAEMYEMDAAGMEVVRAHRILRLMEAEKTTLTQEIQALTIGPFAYVTIPGELFAELGLMLKARSPFPYTFVAELSGAGSGSYTPTEPAYAEGGYEVESSAFVPGSGEQLVETALDLLAEAAQRIGQAVG